jgi:hypothetical protein
MCPLSLLRHRHNSMPIQVSFCGKPRENRRIVYTPILFIGRKKIKIIFFMKGRNIKGYLRRLTTTRSDWILACVSPIGTQLATLPRCGTSVTHCQGPPPGLLPQTPLDRKGSLLHRIQGGLSKCWKDLASVLARIPGMLDQENRDKLVLHVDVHIGAVGPAMTK